MSALSAVPSLAPRALYEEVAELIRQRIFSRELEPGSWIDELQIAKAYGISRTPLREALKVLAATLADGKGAPGEIIGASKDGLLVACGEQALCLTRLQLPGGKALNFSDLFNSRREKFAVGTVLGAAVDAQ